MFRLMYYVSVFFIFRVVFLVILFVNHAHAIESAFIVSNSVLYYLALIFCGISSILMSKCDACLHIVIKFDKGVVIH